MKKIIFLVVFTFVFASCRWININNYGCTKEESQKVSEFAIPYWNKVQRVFDSASVNFGADSTLAKTDPKKVEQKYKQLFKSVFGEDPSVRYLTFGISFPSNYNYKSRTMAGYFLTDTLIKNAKSGTTYSVFDANNNELGTKFRVYAEVIEFSNNNLQSLRFSNDRTEWNSVATLDLHIEIVVPKSVNIKCLNQLITK